MSTTKHTPGPWSITKAYKCNHSPDYFGAIFGPKGKFPRPGEAYGRTREEAQANAHLIAAAPELLESAENLLAGFIHVDGDTKGNKARTDIFLRCPEMGDLCARMREAIAKAEGGGA